MSHKQWMQGYKQTIKQISLGQSKPSKCGQINTDFGWKGKVSAGGSLDRFSKQRKTQIPQQRTEAKAKEDLSRRYYVSHGRVTPETGHGTRYNTMTTASSLQLTGLCCQLGSIIFSPLHSPFPGGSLPNKRTAQRAGLTSAL